MARRNLYRPLLVLLLLLTGCGGDEVVEGMPPPTSARPSPAPRVSRPAARAAAEAPTGPATGVVRLHFLEGSRDPFSRQFPEDRTPLDLDAVELGVEEVVDLGPLANYPVESLRLVAIITRTAEPKAMFMLPDASRLGVLARINDRVGPNGTGRISDIQPNRVIISYEGLGFGGEGEQARTLVLTLRDPGLDIDAEFEPY